MEGVPRIGPHDPHLARSTLLLKDRFPLKTVSERLRHRGIQTTADVYSHVTPDM